MINEHKYNGMLSLTIIMMAGWLHDCLAAWLQVWMAAWLDVWMAEWLDGWMVGSLVLAWLDY